jgi:N-acetylglucosamine-6-sulfatase
MGVVAGVTAAWRRPSWRWLVAVAALGLTLLVVAILIGGGLASRPPDDVARQGGRPNIVVITFDDLDMALAQAMPGWEEIESGAVVFQRSYVTTPLCCPSRASFLTGQWAHTHGVYANAPPDGGYGRAVELGLPNSTLPVWLSGGGYHTALIGRYLNGTTAAIGTATPPGWDDWQQTRRSDYRNYPVNDNGTILRPSLYVTDELARRAVRTLHSISEPFFLWLTPTTPHIPVEIAYRHMNADAPAGVDAGRYRLMLAGMDLLQRVLAAIPDNTYVIVTSDNGFHTVPTWGKDLPYDTDTRVPLLIMGPGLRPAHIDELVANVDLAPTIAEWAGVEAPGVEGVSLVPLLKGRDVTWRRELLLERIPLWQATRTRDRLVIHWADGRVERITD